jgi:ABC-type thiamin/hydroxymethylpyrimidine transport system permease subunit
VTHAPMPMPVPPMPVPGRGLRSPVGLSYAVTALLGFVIVVDLLIVAASLNMRSLMSKVASGGTVDFDEGEASRADFAMAGTSVLYLVAMVATAAVFIIWFHRVRQNADVFAPDTQRRTAGWAIGAWFIPIGNLWIPRGIAADILRAGQSDPYAGAVRHIGLLNAWWGMWVWAAVFDRYASKSYSKAQDVDAIHDAAGLVMAGAGFDMAAAVLAILFVRKVTAAQHTKALAGPPVPQ